MKKLQAGDIRQEGDEVRCSGISDEERTKMLQWLKNPERIVGPDEWRLAVYEWTETNMPGVEIIPSDMMHLEYRRP